jgi:hypothetical protein
MAMGYTGETKATKDAWVVSADGHELGRVTEIQDTCFKIDAPLQPDYWLASDTIASDDGGVLRLNLTQDKIGEAKMDSPDQS